MKRLFVSIAGFGLLYLILTMISCTSQKEITYFQDNVDGSSKQEINQNFELVIQPGDILSVQVASLSLESNKYFSYQNDLNNGGGPKSTIPGYLVGEDGTIELPLIGLMKVTGKTTKMVKDSIRIRLENYLESPSVLVRHENFRVSVLGEVNKPGVILVSNERITLPEILGMAGDLTIYAKRNNILLIRETNGTREFVHLNLSSRDIFQSPYYYLRPNDIIYVEPGKAKLSMADNFYKIIPIVLSTLTIISVFASRYI